MSASLNPLYASVRGAANVLFEHDLAGSADAAPGVQRRHEHGASRWLARITGNTSLGGNKWRYTWQEVFEADTAGTYTTAGRTSTSHGNGYNTIEAPNSASGLQGNGVTIANLPAGFTIQPVATGAVVEMVGPFGASGARWCRFSVVNAVDGECP